MLYVARVGLEHGGPPGAIKKAEYDIKSNTWGGWIDVYDDEYDDSNLAGGITSDGTIFIFTGRWETWDDFKDMGYVKSTDGGESWSDYTTVNILPLVHAATYGRLVDMGGGVYLQTIYGIDVDGIYSSRILRSSDSGASWSMWSVIWEEGTEDAPGNGIDETSVAHIGGNKLVALARRLDGDGYVQQSVSSDGGASWSRPEDTNLGSPFGTKIPQLIYDSESDKLIVVYLDRNTYYIIASEGDASTIFNNAKGWDEPKILARNVDLGYPSLTKISSGKYYWLCARQYVGAGFTWGGFYPVLPQQFSVEITPPPQQISMGEHSLTVMATSQGRYSGASMSLTIDISQFSIQADIQVPQLIVIPEPIEVSGKVYHGPDALQDASVSISFRQSSTTVKTSTDGSFTAIIEAPLDLSLVGPQGLTITVEPVEPWYTSLQTKRWIFTVNPASIGLMLVVFIFMGLLVYTRVRAKPSRPRKEMAIPKAIVPEPSAITPSPRPKYEFTGIKGRILSAYLNGLEVVEKVTGVSMAPHTTLREFLKATTPRLPGATKSFTELTTLAEIALYSAHKLDKNTAARAEQIATIIREELESGAA